MKDLSTILRSSWGSEKWILEGWNIITDAEKNLIINRMDELFKDGLPFEIKHSKLLYIYTFSLLAQLEVLAIQVPLKFEHRMTSPEHKDLLHTQLLDEIFHGMVFTKIVYLLCDPFSNPPAYNDNVERLCNFIRNEECPKISIMLLNLVSEGWIEEVFTSLELAEIAPKVFKTILNDEHRHVCEADLYQDVGLPDLDVVREKLEYLEEQLLTGVFLQFHYASSMTTLLGINGTGRFVQALNAKHIRQLSKINLVPSDKWFFFMQLLQGIMPKVGEYTGNNIQLEMTPTRQASMTQWDNPSDPTMVGEFDLNVTCIDFFTKKFPPETITTLMLQTLSLGLEQYDYFRTFLSNNQLYQSADAYTGIVVQLPDCNEHLSTIVFKNCHKMSATDLTLRIRQIMQLMVVCYKKREELEKAHPHLKQISEDIVYDFANDVYGFPVPGLALVTLSNIGHCGYTRAKSPLRRTEAMKLTILEVNRKQVWNKQSKQFEEQDLLPVTISADHRIFDANFPIPKITQEMFNQVFKQMLKTDQKPTIKPLNRPELSLLKTLDALVENNLEFCYKALTLTQTLWPEFMDLENVFNPAGMANMAEMV